MITTPSFQIQVWSLNRLVFYARNPRKNDAAVDRMCASIREFGFKIPVLARSDGEVVDGHLRLKAARKLGSWPGGDINSIPVILCDEWTPQQVRAFRLMVNRSVTWADWDEELVCLELQDLNAADFDLSLSLTIESSWSILPVIHRRRFANVQGSSRSPLMKKGSMSLYSRIFTVTPLGAFPCAIARNACSDCATIARARSFL